MEARQKYTPEWIAGVLSEELCKEVILNHLDRTVLPGLWPIIINILVSSFTPGTGPRTLRNRRVQLFAKMDPTTEVCECMPTLIMGVAPPPFLTPKKPSVHVQTGLFP